MASCLIKKPFIVRPWSKNISYEKESLKTILVWMRFPELGMHYRGERSVRKIAGMLGKVIRNDNATLNKDRVQLARILVEINMKGEFYDTLTFTNEDEDLIRVIVEYDSKSTVCVKCKQYGH